MTDGRSNRKARVVPFISLLEKDREANLAALIDKSKKLELEGFDKKEWDQSTWKIKSGRLIKHSGKNVLSASILFQYPPKLEGIPFPTAWSNLTKAIFLIRLHRKHQSLPNQRNFIAAVAHVVYIAEAQKKKIFELTPEHLDTACTLISSHYSNGVAYNMHKSVREFAAHCDANGLCKVFFDYKFSKMKRPENTSGVGYKRLDDPETTKTNSDKLISPDVFRVIGELYQNVPKDHKYRFYVLVMTLLACLGRRFSEIALLPNQEINYDKEDRAFLEYFPRKFSHGDTFTPKRKLFLPTQTIEIITGVLIELTECCSAARKTATEMQRTNGPDLTFLNEVLDDQPLYKEDLAKLKLPPTLLDIRGWLRTNGYTFTSKDRSSTHGNPLHFTTKSGVIKYCQKKFFASLVSPIHIDQQGREYYLKDLLLIRSLGYSSRMHSHWIATQCTHAMITTFFRYIGNLVSKYASSTINANFTSHHFRHTLNTLLDEGGLTDLLQTEWFGRKNPHDTKAYQHTSREKRALMLREDIKKGRIGGRIVDKLKSIPITVQDAFLKARVNAVHDVGSGICVHNFVQTPCERHLQCSADCKDYVWAKDDKGRVDDLKRQYSMTVIARETAEEKSKEKNAKRSIDWLTHNNKKLTTLSKQLADNNIAEFDPHQYLEELTHE